MNGIIRTDSRNDDFVKLVKLLDVELAVRDGDEHEFFAQINRTSLIKYVVIAYENGEAVACGSLKEFDHETLEVKRMYVLETHRRKGLAIGVLKALEEWAVQLGFHRLILETGKNQPEAIGLYKRMGYEITENFGPFVGIESSVCFRKNL